MEFLLSAPARFEAVVPQHRAPEKKTMTRSARYLSISRQRDFHGKAEPARNAHGALTPNAALSGRRASNASPRSVAAESSTPAMTRRSVSRSHDLAAAPYWIT